MAYIVLFLLLITSLCSGNENFTEEEKAALKKFRPVARPILTNQKSDDFLITWLRARDLNVRAAYEMLLEAQKWREEFGLDGIINETIYDLNPRPYDVTGFSREGYPVIVIAPGHIDLRKYVVSGEKDKIFRYLIQMVEFGLANRKEASRRAKKEIVEVIVIVDFHGFNIRQHACLQCVPIFRDIFLAFEERYPGVAKYLIAINVPRAALPFIEIMKPIVSEQTLKAFRVFPPDRKEWSDFLSQLIDPAELPYRFGGTREN